ncbi:MAG: calcium/sodium antiporter [Acidobacteria bacterium]|nr:calcium/sodium antiporter [Acidobacteriota bacterium]
MTQSLFDIIVNLITLWPAVLLFVIGGVACLKYGADYLVNGASNIGLRFGMSAALTGLTIVAFGTSAPELVVSILTAIQGQPELCLGNVVGSNIANTALILGGTALITPLIVPTRAIRTELLLSAVCMVAVWLFAFTGLTLGRVEGLVLLVIFGVWMGTLIRLATRTAATTRALGLDTQTEEPVFHKRSLGVDIGLVSVGLAGLVFGADSLVCGAVATARALQVPDVVVGLTVVAGGTSLPEFAVCLVAAFKHQAEITLGNILGSNIFNALLILGTCALIQPISFAMPGTKATLWVDMPVCILLSAVLIPMLYRKGILGRKGGFLLLMAYVTYIVSLILRNS